MEFPDRVIKTVQNGPDDRNAPPVLPGMPDMDRIGFGGGCHWCTEAVFRSITGVENVAAGFLASTGKAGAFSEGVIVCYSPSVIALRELILIHLHSHSSRSDHSMRIPYRSAIYTFNLAQSIETEEILQTLKADLKDPFITKVYPLRAFKPGEEAYQDYYYRNPGKPFCERYILPKLTGLAQKFPDLVHAPGPEVSDNP